MRGPGWRKKKRSEREASRTASGNMGCALLPMAGRILETTSNKCRTAWWQEYQGVGKVGKYLDHAEEVIHTVDIPHREG